VRDYACRGLPVSDAACISCGQCIAVCPRGTLRWEQAATPVSLLEMAQ
jgi:Fe-S-cluster-containing hydrogenase component 2